MIRLITLLLWLIATVGLAGATVHIYRWDVESELKSPDSYKKQVITINGETPGPTIQARQGDIIFVRATNKLKENLAIYWSGAREIDGLWSDGTEVDTRRPILPGQTFTYRFIVDRAGKFSYRSYSRTQAEDGLHGLIQVLPPGSMAEPFSYDYDKSIILDDWYYKSHCDWAAEPESLLIPGKGEFDCAKSTTPSSHPTTCNAINPECSHCRVVPGKTHRLNISSVTAQSTLSFRIEGHNLSVVEAAGHYVEPFVVQNLIINSGKTYSVLIKADQDPSRNYWITTNIVGQNATATTPLGLAVLSYSPPAGPIQNDVTPQSVQSLGNKARQEYLMMFAFLLMQV